MPQTRSGRRTKLPSNEALGNRQQAQVTNPSLAASVHWERLPIIVQEAVLWELAEDYNRHSHEDKRRRAAYAAVTLQWQIFFERLNFKKLVLHPLALKEFERIVKRRSHCSNSGKRGCQRRRPAAESSPSVSRMPRISYIWLCIELLPYDCTKCKLPEDAREVVRNNVIFTKAVWILLNILSGWEKRDSNQDLTLELSAHSPSDPRHCFQDNAGLQDDYPNLDPINTQRDYIICYEKGLIIGDDQLNDLFHGFSAGRYNSSLTETPRHPEAIAERLIRPLEFDFFGVPSNDARSKGTLPQVKMISSFVLRRQFYRELRPSAFSKLFRETLIGLRNIRYERWRLPDPLSQMIYEMEFGPMVMRIDPMDQDLLVKGALGHGLPSSLETLSLFEDTGSKSPNVKELSGIPTSRIQVLNGLSGRAVNLKHLSISFLSDAIDCLKFPVDALPNLQSLIITSKEYLQPNNWKVREILLYAAKAVTKLPKLQIMELWNCENGYAAILRYEIGDTVRSRTCELTWRSSWHSTIGADVIKAWKHAAYQLSRELIIALDPLPPNLYSHYGTILRYLKLRDFILDPISAMQIQVGIDTEGQPEVPTWRASIPYSPMRSASHPD